MLLVKQPFDIVVVQDLALEHEAFVLTRTQLFRDLKEQEAQRLQELNELLESKRETITVQPGSYPISWDGIIGCYLISNEQGFILIRKDDERWNKSFELATEYVVKPKRT